MKDIPKPEFLDNNGENEEGCIIVETSLKELTENQISTCCGYKGNKAFQPIYELAGDRTVIGWYDPNTNEMVGMIYIEGTEEEGETFSELAYENGDGGSLRYSRKSMKEGFLEFEIE